MLEHPQPVGTPRNALVSGDPVAIEIATFLRHLEACYRVRHLQAVREPEASELRSTLFSLELAIASLDRDILHRAVPDLPPQLGLLGPTQAGKSSLANWLLGADRAEVSPLAGFTIHPQGFCWGPDPDGPAAGLTGFFQGLERVAPVELTRDRLASYTLTHIGSTVPSQLAPAACIWDTPDFDAVDSEFYRSQVLRIAALADLVILVISKDKYADQTVWDMLGLLESLQQPALVVMNKIDDPARDLLLGSLHEKWQAARGDDPPPVVTIPFTERIDSLPPREAIGNLQRLVRGRVTALPELRQHRRLQTRSLLQHHWSRWLASVRAEQRAAADWTTVINDALDEALTRYRQDYLDHPHHYETFQRALARLLTLLEIPGVAGALAGARRMLTWPFRQLSSLGRGLRGATTDEETTSAEETILLQIGDHVLLRLHRLALAKRDADSPAQDWWHALAEILRRSRHELRDQFVIALHDYVRAFQPEVDNTARELYERLEERPVVLNSLRATRITTDAAALALALHSGGIGIQDFVIAPATLAVTSMLTESALGRYVDRAADQLRRRQLAAVKGFLDQCLRQSLAALPGQLDATRHFRVSSERVARIEALLNDYA